MSYLKQLKEQISPAITEEEILNIAKRQANRLNNVKLVSVQLSSDAGKKGDSYLSKICKFTILASGTDQQGKEQQVFIPVIAKAVHTNLSRRKTFRSADFFENETLFYVKVWPAHAQFQSTKNIDKPFHNIPLILSYCDDGTNDYVAFEDLTYQKFECLGRGDGLNFEHTVEILRLFAQFHGLGLAFKDQKPQEFEKIASSLKETYFDERLRGWYIKFQRTRLFPVIQDAVSKELGSVYLEKLNKFLDNDLFARLCKICQVRGKFSVVTHGDSWVPNFLFKYSNDRSKPDDIMMIDFQLARYTTLTNDILFFLFCCLEHDKLDKHFDDFISIYYKMLKEHVAKLGSTIPFTFEEFKEDIKTSVTFGIGMSIENLPMSLLEDDEVCDLDSISSDEAVPLDSIWIVEPFKDQAKRQRIAGMIKFAVDRNFI